MKVFGLCVLVPDRVDKLEANEEDSLEPTPPFTDNVGRYLGLKQKEQTNQLGNTLVSTASNFKVKPQKTKTMRFFRFKKNIIDK